MHKLDASHKQLRIQQADKLQNKDSWLVLGHESSKDSTLGRDRVNNNASGFIEGQVQFERSITATPGTSG